MKLTLPLIWLINLMMSSMAFSQDMTINFRELYFAESTDNIGNYCVSGISMRVWGNRYGFSQCTPVESNCKSDYFTKKIIPQRFFALAHYVTIQKTSFPKHWAIDTLYSGGNVVVQTYYKGAAAKPVFGRTIVNFQNVDSVRVYGTALQFGIIETSGYSCYMTLSPKYFRNSVPDCNDPDITFIDKMLLDSKFLQRKDYHIYQVETVICDPGKPGKRPCTVDAVWDFIKSDNTYQIPIYDDFPASTAALCLPDVNMPLNPILKAFQTVSETGTGPFHVPIQNCSKVYLSPTPARAVLGTLLYLNKALSINLFSETCDVSPLNEPVKIVVDESNRKITNYTLQGHFLYPGKIERRVIIDGCNGKIKIITVGQGATTCGENVLGKTIKALNICIGEYMFSKIDKRVMSDFEK